MEAELQTAPHSGASRRLRTQTSPRPARLSKVLNPGPDFTDKPRPHPEPPPAAPEHGTPRAEPPRPRSPARCPGQGWGRAERPGRLCSPPLSSPPSPLPPSFPFPPGAAPIPGSAPGLGLSPRRPGSGASSPPALPLCLVTAGAPRGRGPGRPPPRAPA